MKAGLSTLYCLGKSFRILLKELKNAPVSNIELVDEGLHFFTDRRIASIKKIVRERDFTTTVHAPFADINIASPNRDVWQIVLKRLKKSIRFSSNLGSTLWVFHPGLRTGISHIYPGLDWRINMRAILELKRIADKQGLRIAIENGPSPFPFLLKNVDDFLKFYDELRDDDIGITLDVGHANLNGQIPKFVESFPDRIVHVHVHDNLGDRDAHLGIGEGNIDWHSFLSSLKYAGYQGMLIVESEKNVHESLFRLKEMLSRL